MYSVVLATATAALKETKEVKTDMLRSISKQSGESVESVLKKMQTICTSLQADNHTNTSSLNFLQARCSS